MDNQIPQPVDQTAVNFVETEWQKAQTTLRRARYFAIGSVLFVAAYMTFLTVTLQTRLLEPKPAAQVATHYVTEFIRENGEALSQQLIAEVPRYIAQAPDYALAQLPVMRADLEAKLETTLVTYSREFTPQLTAMVDEFLIVNQPAIREFLDQGSDPAAVGELGEQFEKHVLAALSQKGPDGFSAADQLADGVTALTVAEQRLHRLAYADDLTTEEKQLRRVLGLILQQARQSAQSS